MDIGVAGVVLAGRRPVANPSTCRFADDLGSGRPPSVVVVPNFPEVRLSVVRIESSAENDGEFLSPFLSERTFLRYGGRFCRARIVRVPCRNLRRTGACRPTRRCGRARGGNMRKNTYLWSSEHSAEAGLCGRVPAREAGSAIGRVGRTAGGLWGEGSLSYDHGQIGP